MMVLYDEEEIMRSYVESEVYDSKIETAKRLLRMEKLSYEEIASGSGLAIEEVEELANELQPVQVDANMIVSVSNMLQVLQL